MNKSINDLVPEDFHQNSIWQPVDDLEDPEMEVRPFLGDSLNMEEMYLIAARFRLADKSEYKGYIRFSWGKPIEMALAINNSGFLYFAVQRQMETEERHLEFAKSLNRTFDGVFPIEYQTSIDIRLRGAIY